MITKVYPDSGLKAKDFIVGEQIIIQDPRGDSFARLRGQFQVGDICTVQSVGDTVVHFKVNKNGYITKAYAYRLGKLSHFRIKDVVTFSKEDYVISKIDSQGVYFQCNGIEKYVTNEAIKLKGRKVLI